MKKFLFVFFVSMILFISIIPVAALETKTYQFVASNNDVTIPLITYRTGDILVSTNYKPANHGIYVIWILDSSGNWLCHSTYDFRWGRTPPLPQPCSTINAPIGKYSVVFRAVAGGKTSVIMNITAETDQ